MQHYPEMANLPLAVLQQFPPLSKYFHFRCVAADLVSPGFTYTHMGVSGFPSKLKGRVVLHQPGCLHGDRAEHLYCRGEP